jgi:hypothetical protein
MNKCKIYWLLGALTIGVWMGCETTPAERQEAGFLRHTGASIGLDFANQLIPTEDFNIIEYLYYYNGGGVAVGDINNDQLPDIYFTGNEVPNKLFLNQGGLRFEDITTEAGVAGAGTWKTGVTMADVNGDGWLDIYVCQVGDYKVCQGKNQLFINNQDGTFTDRAAQWGLDFKGFSTQAAFFDYDLDGDLDCYLLNHSVHSTENYGQSSLRLRRDSLGGDRLFRNDGTYFVDVSQSAGIFGSRLGYGLGLGIGDLNNDGFPDIYVSNDFHENDYLYYNNGDGTFTEGIQQSVAHTSTFSMGNDLADVNNDGRIDLLSLDMKPADEVVAKSSVGAEPYNIYQLKRQFGYHAQYPRNMLQINQGQLKKGPAVQFQERAYLAGVDATDWSWAPLFCDLDNDGWKDLFVANGIWQRPNDLDYLKFISNQQISSSATDLQLAAEMPDGNVANFAFRNSRGEVFEDISDSWNLNWKGCSTGAAYADFDLDGDLDLVTNNLNAQAQLFENKLERGQHHFLTIRLEGQGKNTAGIGARLQLSATDAQQVQELYTTRGFQSAVPPVVHFGLGKNTAVDRLEVRWPNGSWQLVPVSVIDTQLVIQYAPNMAPPATAQETPGFRLAGWRLDFLHQENDYIDFDVEKLMPFSHSRLGPALATGDLNGDGLEDAYLGGARGYPGMVFLQAKDGIFEPQDPTEFEPYQYLEETAATFIDADKDGDLDLYIAGGGGENLIGVNAFGDRLYRNDGRGWFTLIEDALPPGLSINASCVTPLDFDGDGAMDLFLGGYSVPGAYGQSPASALLRNTGSGRFEDVTNDYLDDPRLGMVTAAVVIPGERKPKLAVVGEWMPITLLTFEGGAVTLSTIENTEGWWQTVHTFDLEGDGQTELLVGNFGENTDLHPTPGEPIELYVGDFDQNQFVDPILTYYKQGQKYSYFGRDMLEQQLVRLKKGHVEYKGFAEGTFSDNFDQIDIQRATQRKAVTFASVMLQKKSGRWTVRELPMATQLSPVMAFATIDLDQDGDQDILGGGNISTVQPALGKLDASYGFVLENDGRGNLIPQETSATGFLVEGDVRDLKVIPLATGQQAVLVARNNNTVLVFDYQQTIQ